ncbi:vWA domain-containing protein [Methylocella sp.]|uniref:vWA domain-containing protein n=1 Tax=Methylocella sp. TaxID=1978226 RepID=UPI0037843BD0
MSRARSFAASLAAALAAREKAVRGDRRVWLLAGAALALAASFLPLRRAAETNGVTLLAVVDVTGSMNVRDYASGGVPQARLDAVKADLRATLPRLPCPARVGLAIFSERRPFLLFEPIDVCAAFAAVDGAIAALDWRMAWEGDSHIAAGLDRSIDLANSLDADLVFFTDGQEAPPLPASGGPPFEGDPNASHGVVMGVGGLSLSPIPKYDDDGREIGFLGMSDVTQENRFGPPPADAESREGYNPRNAPFGAAAASGEEHLSSLRETYLRALAAKTGLSYARLTDAASLEAAIRAASRPRPAARPQDLRPFTIALALALLVLAYAAPAARRAAALGPFPIFTRRSQ